MSEKETTREKRSVKIPTNGRMNVKTSSFSLAILTVCGNIGLMKKEVPPVRISLKGEDLEVDVFTNRILNYRYHWHDDLYEITMILRGKAIYSRAGETYELEEDDVIIIEPLTGHASLSMQAGTVSLTLHFNASIFERIASKNTLISFGLNISNKENRMDKAFRALRAMAADLILATGESGPYCQMEMKAAAGQLIPILLRYFQPLQREVAKPDPSSLIDASAITAYVNDHFREKLSLNDLAEFSGYNRTYLSTLFKTRTGINFHTYLTRIRLKYSLSDLAYTEKNMTQTAIDNGFPDLKTFNTIFTSTFHISPMAYRDYVRTAEKAPIIDSRIYHDPKDRQIVSKLQQYSERGIYKA